jgi:quercetin dioxygenase-like cupin family protein
MTHATLEPPGEPAVAVLTRSSPRRPLTIVEQGGSAEAIVWPGMGSRWRSLHRIELEAGGRTVVLRHPSEAAYFVKEGDCDIVDEATGDRIPLPQGSMVHVGAGRPYRFVARGAVEVLGGPCPPDRALYGDGPDEDVTGAGDASSIRAFHKDRPSHLLPLISSDARLVVWPGVGAELANLNYVSMEPGEANTPHAHDESEDTIYILEGKGSIDDLTNGARLEFEAGDVVHVPAGVRHAVRADRGSGVVSFGGPCPPDTALFGHAVPVESADGGKDLGS